MIRWTPLEVVPGELAARPVDVVGRLAGVARGPAFWITLWVAAIGAEALALVPIVDGDLDLPGYIVVFFIVPASFTACGLIAWHRRPDSHIGALMTLTGFGLTILPIGVQLSPGWLLTLADLSEDLWALPFVALLLTTLTQGRLVTPLDRALVLAWTIPQPILEAIRLSVGEDPGGPIQYVQRYLTTALCVAVAIVIAARWRAASPPRRRAMLPSVAGVSCLVAFGMVQIVPADDLPLLGWIAAFSLLTVPAAFLAGQLRSRLARGGLTELFAELGTMRGETLRAALARALGDPGLVLAYRQPGSQRYLDTSGAPVAIPPPDAGRSVADVDNDGRRVAAIVYDASLDDDPEMVEAVRAGAAIAIEHERLHVESEERLAQLRASRERLVSAGDAERRRIERNLHDGAQQRLVALALQLRLARGRIHADPAAAELLVTAAGDELARSLEELRELARGIHPAVLDHGLPAALESLASRSPVAASVVCEVEGALPEPVELAAYFVASEALTNVAKYSGAVNASVRVTPSPRGVLVEVADDGAGGADPEAGSGLRGLMDRVEALDGTLVVVSPPGKGTVVVAEIPCAS